ncbi:peptidyl-prolyl cis-trans isomerase [Haloferula rosea]|uniref:Peptidyl-prolyl cis-trans isomerase n=1 Tax=Haloferula rosea TaxID=490093 RepID=A0A934RF16_9BACT|nr:peptidylprolyl isomerase [Haloferula rosea]MBK1828448.1 peptidyl-prolyl cis-trans isomerase [Haloferula rosea]
MKLLRDPLVVFLLIGAGIFLLYSKVAPSESVDLEDPYRIDINGDILAILEDEWTARWNRPPTETEFKGLVDAYVKEEILYREAKKLGLDQSDSIIRRRLAQKMEFLTSDIADLEEIAPETLEGYLNENSARYAKEPEVGFEQLFFSPEKRENPKADAETMLEQLNSGAVTFEESNQTSDPTLLSPKFTATAVSQIGRQFGEAFVEAIADEEPGSWFGPVESSYGMHLVRITERAPGGLPALESIREKVESDYRYDQREKLNQQMLDQLLQSYDVVIGEEASETEAS